MVISKFPATSHLSTITWPTGEGEGKHVLPQRPVKTCKEESAYLPSSAYMSTHIYDRLVSTWLTWEKLYVPSHPWPVFLPTLPAVGRCGIVRIRTCDLLTTERTIFYCEPFFFFSSYPLTALTWRSHIFNKVSELAWSCRGLGSPGRECYECKIDRFILRRRKSIARLITSRGTSRNIIQYPFLLVKTNQ